MYQTSRLLAGGKVIGYWGYFFLWLVLVKFVLVLELKLDFSSFYASIKAYDFSLNPYKSFPLDFLKGNMISSVNLNPPFFILITRFFSHLDYGTALWGWQLLSLFCFFIATSMTLKYFEISEKKYFFMFAFSYPILINFFISQIGAFIFLLIISGLFFYKKQKIVTAGILWGIVTGIKLFPGLLIFYALKERQYKLSLTIFIIFFVTLLIPYFNDGIVMYKNYLSALERVDWYMHVWNASLHGFLARIDSVNFLSTFSIKIIKYICLIASFFSYVYLFFSNDKHIKSQFFNITIIYMILLSPLGWCYYFNLLIIPISAQIKHFKKFPLIKKNIFLFSLLLLMFPRNSNELNLSSSIQYKITLGSQYFYGLVLFLASILLPYKEETPFRVESSEYFAAKILLFYFLYGATFYVFFINIFRLYISHIR